MNNTTLSNNSLSPSSFFNHFFNEIDIEQKTYSYSKKKHKSKKEKNNSAFISAAISVTILASAQCLPNVYINESTTESSSNNLNDLDEGDVDMSNNKDTSTQEVRQKDLDSLEKLFNAKVQAINAHVDDKFEVLNTDIKNIKDSLEEIKENTKSKESRHFDFWSICFQAIICIIAAIIGGSIPFFFSK